MPHMEDALGIKKMKKGSKNRQGLRETHLDDATLGQEIIHTSLEQSKSPPQNTSPEPQRREDQREKVGEREKILKAEQDLSKC